MPTRALRYYSQTLKLHVVTEIEAGRLTITQAQRRFGIRARQTIYNWLKTFGQHTHCATKVYVQMKDEQDLLKQREEEIRRLQQEKQALESALAQKELKLLLAESAIIVAERHFGCDEGFIKKNFAPASSTPPETK